MILFVFLLQVVAAADLTREARNRIPPRIPRPSGESPSLVRLVPGTHLLPRTDFCRYPPTFDTATIHIAFELVLS